MRPEEPGVVELLSDGGIRLYVIVVGFAVVVVVALSLDEEISVTIFWTDGGAEPVALVFDIVDIACEITCLYAINAGDDCSYCDGANTKLIFDVRSEIDFLTD